MTYIDSLASPIVLTSPFYGVSGLETKNITLGWNPASGATEYKWQLSYYADFSSIPDDFEGDTTANFARLPALELGITYYWRVMAIEPIVSPWSATGSFTTSLGHGATAPTLHSPGPGASNVALQPLFQWESIAKASSYELLVSADVSFAIPVVSMVGSLALPTNVWRCDVSLDRDTTYYWKVRALNAITRSDWSAVGAFTTKPLPESTPSVTSTPVTTTTQAATTTLIITVTTLVTPPPAPTTPMSYSLSTPIQSPTVTITPPYPDWTNWVIPMGAALLGVLLAILVTLIILVVRTRGD